MYILKSNPNSDPIGALFAFIGVCFAMYLLRSSVNYFNKNKEKVSNNFKEGLQIIGGLIILIVIAFLLFLVSDSSIDIFHSRR